MKPTTRRMVGLGCQWVPEKDYQVLLDCLAITADGHLIFPDNKKIWRLPLDLEGPLESCAGKEFYYLFGRERSEEFYAKIENAAEVLAGERLSYLRKSRAAEVTPPDQPQCQCTAWPCYYKMEP